MVPLAFTWTDFAQQVVSGLATGSIYASLALAIVIIYRSTGVINFAQGEMAMFSTFIAWWLIADPSGPEYHLWIGFALTLAISFAGGVALERLVIRPVEGAPVLTIVMVTLGLGIALFGLAAWIWGADTKRFPSAFSTRTIDVGGVVFSIQDVGFIAVTFGAVALLWLFFRFTKPGLGMRAAAGDRQASRLLGVRGSWMIALGWGLAAMFGALAGMMAAPTIVPRPEHDARHPALRVRGGRAGRARQPARRGRRRARARRHPQPARHVRRLLRRRDAARRRACSSSSASSTSGRRASSAAPR